jgi:hypothetical protein
MIYVAVKTADATRHCPRELRPIVGAIRRDLTDPAAFDHGDHGSIGKASRGDRSLRERLVAFADPNIRIVTIDDNIARDHVEEA